MAPHGSPLADTRLNSAERGKQHACQNICSQRAGIPPERTIQGGNSVAEGKSWNHPIYAVVYKVKKHSSGKN